MNNHKIEFPLWVVIDPTPVSEMVDVVWEVRNFANLENVLIGGARLQGRNPVLYTDGIAAHADAADRLRKRDGKPEWVPLSSLRPGAVFEAQSGWRGVKTADEAPALDIVWCADIGDGKRVQANGADLVKEIL
jgi:hypothetical protein